MTPFRILILFSYLLITACGTSPNNSTENNTTEAQSLVTSPTQLSPETDNSVYHDPSKSMVKGKNIFVAKEGTLHHFIIIEDYDTAFVVPELAILIPKNVVTSSNANNLVSNSPNIDASPQTTTSASSTSPDGFPLDEGAYWIDLGGGDVFGVRNIRLDDGSIHEFDSDDALIE